MERYIIIIEKDANSQPSDLVQRDSDISSNVAFKNDSSVKGIII